MRTAKGFLPSARNQKNVRHRGGADAEGSRNKFLGSIRQEPKTFPRGLPDAAHSPFPTTMIKPSLLLVLAAALTLASGCSLFSKKNPRAKESSAIASEVEESFRRRWMEKRMGELTAQGQAPEAARTQADAEFRERYAFAQPRKK